MANPGKEIRGFIAESNRVDVYGFQIITDVRTGNQLSPLSPSHLPNPIPVRAIYCMKMQNFTYSVHNDVDLRVHQW